MWCHPAMHCPQLSRLTGRARWSRPSGLRGTRPSPSAGPDPRPGSPHASTAAAPPAGPSPEPEQKGLHVTVMSVRSAGTPCSAGGEHFIQPGIWNCAVNVPPLHEQLAPLKSSSMGLSRWTPTFPPHIHTEDLRVYFRHN